MMLLGIASDAVLYQRILDHSVFGRRGQTNHFLFWSSHVDNRQRHALSSCHFWTYQLYSSVHIRVYLFVQHLSLILTSIEVRLSLQSLLSLLMFLSTLSLDASGQ
jgi:hypothetical protein